MNPSLRSVTTAMIFLSVNSPGGKQGIQKRAARPSKKPDLEMGLGFIPHSLETGNFHTRVGNTHTGGPRCPVSSAVGMPSSGAPAACCPGISGKSQAKTEKEPEETQ